MLAGLICLVATSPARAEVSRTPDRAALVKAILTHPQIELERGPDDALHVTLCRCPVPVPLWDIPSYLRLALVSTEDKRFYSPLHAFGFDPLGLLRALAGQFVGGREGGSGIDQQLSKNLIEGDRRTIGRKFAELMDASRIAADFSDRNEVIAAYLNTMSFGSVHGEAVIGIEQAARAYFGKPTTRLNLYESAVLVGMLRAPTKYNPERHPQATRARAEHVLGRMVAEHAISQRQMDVALRIGPRPGNLHPLSLQTAFYTSWIRRQLAGLPASVTSQKRLRVVVGLDPRLQLDAEERATAMIRHGRTLDVDQAAIVAMDDTGLVKALIGGTDFATSQYDHATIARRQPGSAFKPFVYLRALEAGMKPTDTILDAPVQLGWPRNFEARYWGKVQLRFALANSLNAASVRLAETVGPEKVVALAHRLGIVSPLRADRSLALGTSEVSLLELTGAYATIANGGMRVTPHGIIAVLTEDGAVLWADTSRPGPRVIPRRDAAAITGMLRDVVASGTGRPADFGGYAVGKTGTTQDFRDAWFVGFDRRTGLTTGIWTGNDNDAPTRGVTGSSLPAVAWHDFYRELEPRPSRIAEHHTRSSGRTRTAGLPVRAP